MNCNERVSITGPRFSEPRFPGEFPPPPPFSDYPLGDYGEPGFGGYSNRQDFPDPDMSCRPFPDGMGHHPAAGGDGFGSGGGIDGYGRSGLMEDSPRRRYPDEYRGSQMGSGLMDRPVNKPLDTPGSMGAAPDNDNNRGTLLTYLVGVSFHTIYLAKSVNTMLLNYSHFRILFMFMVSCICRIPSG